MKPFNYIERLTISMVSTTPSQARAREKIFCKYCKMWLNSPKQWEDHKIGKRHMKYANPKYLHSLAEGAAGAARQAAEQPEQKSSRSSGAAGAEEQPEQKSSGAAGAAEQPDE